MKIYILTLLIALCTFGCKTTTEDVEKETEQTEQVKENEEKTEPSELKENNVSSFGARFENANRIEIETLNESAPIKLKEGKAEIAEQAKVEALIAAVGKETKKSDAVPRCIGSYRISFFDGESLLGTFNSVCSTAEVVLVEKGTSYAAANSEAFMDIIKTVSE